MLVFVYGTLKRQHCRGSIMRDQTFIGEATTKPLYRLYDVGAFPAMVEDESGFGIGIQGELYDISNECKAVLDRIEGAPFLYKLKRIYLDTHPDKEVYSYIYQHDITKLDDCGNCWKGN